MPRLLPETNDADAVKQANTLSNKCLAKAVKDKLPNIERLLNLDGGPSTALAAEKLTIANLLPVKNYIFQKQLDVRKGERKK